MRSNLSFGQLEYKPPTSVPSTNIRRIETRSHSRTPRSSHLIEGRQSQFQTRTPPRAVRKYGKRHNPYPTPKSTSRTSFFKNNNGAISEASGDESYTSTSLLDEIYPSFPPLPPDTVQTILPSAPFHVLQNSDLPVPITADEDVLSAEKQLMRIHQFIKEQETDIVILKEKVTETEGKILNHEKLLAEKEVQLEKIAEVLKTTSVCGICYAHMLKPFVVRECGHTFCGSCLRSWFSTYLKKHLDRFVFLKLHRSERYEASSTPTCRDHLYFTIRALRRGGVTGDTLKEVFHYDCPMCRIIVKKPPMDCTIAWGILSGVEEALKDQPDLLPKCYADESSVTHVRFFDGLFLDTYDRTEYKF